jgi:serpin B
MDQSAAFYQRHLLGVLRNVASHWEKSMKPFCIILTLALCAGRTCGVSDEKKESVNPKNHSTTQGQAKDGLSLHEKDKGDPTATEPAKDQEPEALAKLADLKMLVQGNSEFAFDLYARLSKEKGNIVFSPYSISTALAMTYGGARGETAKEMAKVLRFTLPQERLHPTVGKLMADLHNSDEKRPFRLYIANSLWGQRGFAFKREFIGLAMRDYHAEFGEVDFMNDTDGSRKVINRWVEKQTNNLIKELLLDRDVTRNTRLVLTNAVYFKATWTFQFSKDDTKDAPFAVGSSENVMVPMMHKNRSDLRYKYFAGNDFQWLELPYRGDRLSMVLLLPQKKGNLADLEKTLTAAALGQGISNLKYRPGTVALPRFKTACQFSLAEKLAEMGMPLAFDAHADFSGIADGLNIAKAIHKTYIDVDEMGTEAAAATIISANASQITPFIFRADHPFLFIIRDIKSGTILFQGRVTDPRPGRT